MSPPWLTNAVSPILTTPTPGGSSTGGGKYWGKWLVAKTTTTLTPLHTLPPLTPAHPSLTPAHPRSLLPTTAYSRPTYAAPYPAFRPSPTKRHGNTGSFCDGDIAEAKVAHPRP